MKKVRFFVGIDISKLTLDFALNINGSLVYYHEIENTKPAIKKFIQYLKKSFKVDFSNTVFCLEHTGCYGHRILDVLLENEANIWMESGSQIKRSMGLVRGKSDKIDCKKIAEYAYTHVHKMKQYKAPRKIIQQLKVLSSERSRLVKCKRQLGVAIKEQTAFLDKSLMKETQRRTKKITDQIKHQIKAIDEQIIEIYNSDQHLKRICQIVRSVPGIGLVTSLQFIVTTEEFTKITEAKKFACYAGVAPFEHTSGTSIRGKSRVSHMADKKTKTVLHMAALSAVCMKGELKDFFDRKVKEGKNKMSIINAVRNKLILRVFACVKQNRLFEKDYEYALVNP